VKGNMSPTLELARRAQQLESDGMDFSKIIVELQKQFGAKHVLDYVTSVMDAAVSESVANHPQPDKLILTNMELISLSVDPDAIDALIQEIELAADQVGSISVLYEIKLFCRAQYPDSHQRQQIESILEKAINQAMVED